jgi:hypothetical protein
MLIAQIDDGIISVAKTISEVGFAGAFIVAAWLCFWLIRARREDWKDWLGQVIQLQNQTTQVVKENTTAFCKLIETESTLSAKLVDLGTAQQKLYERLLERPCMLTEEELAVLVEKIHPRRRISKENHANG